MAGASLEDVLEDALSGALAARVHVSLPGRVIRYDRTTQTAAVQPIVRARFRLENDSVETYRLPVLPAVPVCFPQGGGCSITWDLAADDDVLLVISERSLDEWKATASGDVEAQDARRFDLSDAVALAGLSSPSAPLAAVLAGTMVVSAPAIALGSASAAQAFVLGTAFKTLYNAHTHATPAGPSGPPAVLMDAVPGTHLSTKIKGE